LEVAMNIRRSILLGCVAFGAALVLVPAFGHEGHKRGGGVMFDINAPRKPSAATAALIGLRTAEVDFGDVEDVIALGGVVGRRPDGRLIVAAPIAGTVMEMRLQPGDQVKRGDVMAVMHSPALVQMTHDAYKTEAEYGNMQTELISARGGLVSLRNQLDSAEKQANVAEDDLARATAEGSGVGPDVVSQRRSAAIQARAQVETLRLSIESQSRAIESQDRNAKAVLGAAGALRDEIDLVRGKGADASEGSDSIGLVRVRARIDGVVSKRGVVAGEGVEAGQMIAEIVDFAKLQVEGDVPESLMSRMPGDVVGRAVRVRRAGIGEAFVAGRVRAMAPMVDAVTRTARLLVDIESTSPELGLRDGMLVDLAVAVRKQKHVVVAPLSAVLSDGPGRYVFIKERDQFRKRDIRLGAAGDDRVVEITEGLVPGDEIVVSGAFALSQVRPEMPGAEGGPAGGGPGAK
jgi:multidrug efflux pump subunit AcrA (membrane-fusion protein)